MSDSRCPDPGSCVVSVRVYIDVVRYVVAYVESVCVESNGSVPLTTGVVSVRSIAEDAVAAADFESS